MEEVVCDTGVRLFLDAEGCAGRYQISARHWLRLVDSGRAPRPVRFGRSVRWRVADLEKWEAEGCGRCRS